MGRDTGVTTQNPTQLSEEPIWPKLSDQVPMDDADASTHPRAFFPVFGGEPRWPPSHFGCFGEEAAAAIGVIEWTLMVLVLGSSVPATLTC